ncbi:MAG: glycosyltransferase [Eubacterium sp.]|nr:glycosyltransferase [Eubacterium sp.]
MSKKKIYITLFTLATGGAERHVSHIANYLSDLGYDITIVLLSNGIVNYHLNSDIEVVDLQSLDYPNTIGSVNVFEKIQLKYYKLFSSKKYEWHDHKIWLNNYYFKKFEYYFSKQENIQNSLVISFMTVPNICASVSKKNMGYKLILAEFNSPSGEFSCDTPEDKLRKKYFNECDGFVFQTEEERDYYSYLGNYKSAIIPNPLEVIDVQPSGKRNKVIVNFCRLATVKNIPLLVDAFSMLYEDYPDYKLVIYGEGYEKQNILNHIKEKHLEDSIEIRPFSSNVLELVCNCAMFVSSSNIEGISNSMIEAMAIGLPTICTDCPAGGARMFIKSYENGILTPVGDAEALYKAMKYMIENPDKAEQMGKKAMEIRETLKKEKILNKWGEFIKEVIEK